MKMCLLVQKYLNEHKITLSSHLTSCNDKRQLWTTVILMCIMSATPINHKIALDVFELTSAIQSPSEEFCINTLSITKFAFSMHFKLTKMNMCKSLDYKEHQNILCIKREVIVHTILQTMQLRTHLCM